MNIFFKTGFAAILLAIVGFTAAAASDSVTLSFNRSGSTAESVTVNASGIEGVTAKVTSVSTALKSVQASILCPDVNGNTSPTITMVMTVSGLPSDFKFNTMGLDIHALNASGAYQAHNDGKTRQWNVEIATGQSEADFSDFASLTDIDIAAGVNPEGSERHQVWFAEKSSAVIATSPFVIKLTVTKGTKNDGCFFGLSSITLSLGEVEPEPPTPPTPPEISEGKVYTIKWKNNTSNYMTEAENGGIVIGSYSTFSKIFWELIPTDNEDCYYVRNTASGLYIGSCNMTPSSASKVTMSATPVEYYIHQSAATSGDNMGCWWMSSTDCANFDQEASGARCLNKDGASTSIITWTTGVSNVGSYWSLAETDDLYEARPFNPSSEIGKAQFIYHILNPADGSALTSALSWAEKADVKEQRWYFVGTSNADGGYQIVNGETNEPINFGKSYKVVASDLGYKFLDADGQNLQLSGVNEFEFVSIRSDFSRALKVYRMPCGSAGSNWIARVQATGGYSYPLPTKGDGRVNYPLASKPSTSFDVFSKDVVDIDTDETTFEILLGTNATTQTALSVHFDYDGDGIFDISKVVPITGRNASVSLEGHGFGRPISGPGRIRFRLDENGVTDPEADVKGQILDLKTYIHGTSELNPITHVDVNDPARGKAENPVTGVIEATPFGTSLFLYWKADNRIMSTDARYTNVHLTSYDKVYTAYFSPNLEATGLDEALLGVSDGESAIELNGKEISVVGTSHVTHIFVFGLDGNVATANSGMSTISVTDLQPGIYIVKAITESGVATKKIIL